MSHISPGLFRLPLKLGSSFAASILIARLLVIFAVLFSFGMNFKTDYLSIFWAVFFLFVVILYRFNLMNIWVIFGLPWIMILFFSAVEISNHSRGVGRLTVFSVTMILALGLLFIPSIRNLPRISSNEKYINRKFFIRMLVFFIIFSLLNIILAGYIPFFRSLTSGDSGYMDFGVKGIYGLFNAYANALGVTAFYLWMLKDERLYKYTFFSVLIVFFLFVTRQNMVSLLVESFVIYNIIVRRVSVFKISIIILVMLFAFAAIGDLRVGRDISDIAQIKNEFLWIPGAFLWLYSYCYFNILNLDNVISSTPTPLFDGSSFSSLLPSFLRPEVHDAADLLEVSSFTVNSFISPIYQDFGLIGLFIIFSAFCFSILWYKLNINGGNLFLGATGYAVLYFCFLFSFFVNFWFYLPIIFQLFFFVIFSKKLFPLKQ